MITVILNCYKRPHYLERQIKSIKSQTISPSDIWIWHNKPEDGKQSEISRFGCKTATCNHNFKYHGRFAFGLLAQTEYVAFFDDDTIPGDRWFENCLNTIRNGQDGILGTSGVILQGPSYIPNQKIGWNNGGNQDVVKVDLVGHAWFMRKDYLRYLWYEEPVSWDNGEDMQLSYQAQKYGGINTYVPPHPVSDLSLWGSLPELGEKYGDDENAGWRSGSHLTVRNKVVSAQVERGWKLVSSAE